MIHWLSSNTPSQWSSPSAVNWWSIKENCLFIIRNKNNNNNQKQQQQQTREPSGNFLSSVHHSVHICVCGKGPFISTSYHHGYDVKYMQTDVVTRDRYLLTQWLGELLLLLLLLSSLLLLLLLLSCVPFFLTQSCPLVGCCCCCCCCCCSWALSGFYKKNHAQR